jgi:alkenylglycerophosphocholine/alkenylglycerophosphoethanolamine hydrolase
MLAEPSRAAAETASSRDSASSSAARVRTAARRAAFAAFVGLVVLFFAALALGEEGLTRILKPFPVMALAVWAALSDGYSASAGSAASAASRARRAVVGGLVASAIGDALLDIHIDGAFVAGMAAFAAAHLAFIAAMIIRHRSPSLGLTLPFAAWGVGLYLAIWSGLGQLAIPVAVYSVVICAMMWRAAARHAADRSRATFIGLVGALLFGLSDSLLAVKLSGVVFPGIRVLVLASYWAGQAGIAASFVASFPRGR